ncbi:MAG TPA: SDR family oxidoreductase [Dehalococcoidia bacterium]|nr:SDR family oxidoreductase [Dehalococcoidia bacterium]
MPGRLEGRVAIITGAAGYLGRSHSVRLARDGAKVVVTDIEDGSATVEEVKAAGGEAIFQKLDVTDWQEAEQAARQVVQRFGRIDILINNAALTGGIIKPWTEFTPEEWDQNLAVDLKGMFVCARAVFPAMKEQRYGKIINISSGTMLSGRANMLPYVTAKAGVIGLTRSLATELGEFDINVNAILVGFFPHIFEGIPSDIIDGITQEVLPTQAFKRIGDPNDLSAVVAFLASDDSRWITGQAIAVDGGSSRAGG